MDERHHTDLSLITDRPTVQVRAGDFPPHCFAYRVEDESMNGGRRPLPQGTFVIIDPTREPKHDDLVLMYEPGAIPAVRQYFIVGSSAYACTTGIKIDPRPLPQEHVIGVVRGSYMTYDE